MSAQPLLAGALDGFALADVLQLLELGARSGVLAVDGGPLGGGRVLVREGRVVNVTTSDRSAAGVADAVATLLEVPRGRWAFHASEIPEADARTPSDVGMSISAILVEAARGRDERARPGPTRAVCAADVPRLSDCDDATAAPAGGGLTSTHLRVLAAVDGVRDVREIAAALRCDVGRVLGIVDALCGLRLVEVGAVAT